MKFPFNIFYQWKFHFSIFSFYICRVFIPCRKSFLSSRLLSIIFFFPLNFLAEIINLQGNNSFSKERFTKTKINFLMLDKNY